MTCGVIKYSVVNQRNVFIVLQFHWVVSFCASDMYWSQELSAGTILYNFFMMKSSL